MTVSSGIGDPYWYEWYVGLEQVIRMLNSDNGISCVIFQKGDYSTIDDVVVKYNSGRQEFCYQVKHEIETSSKRNLTFNKLLKKEQDGNSLGKSLIDSIATGWDQVSKDTGNEIIPVLYTNRTLGRNSTQRTFKGNSYAAIPLGTFFIELKKKFNNASNIDDIKFSEKEKDFQVQWNEFRDAISISNGVVFSFIKKLSIIGEQSSLTDLRNSLIHQVSVIFGCSREVAEKLFNRLVAELPVWTTSTRHSEEVTVEIVYEALSTKLEISNEQHRLAPPYPFFNSRIEFCQSVIDEIGNNPQPIVFISGEPGAGKTSIISHIQAVCDLFSIRFHAFRPISPEQHFYNADPGLCEPRALWTELMVQIRSKLKGKLYKYAVPVCCDYCSDDHLRSEVLRLLGAIKDETGEMVYVCIDGIDHAARSSSSVTFLSSLFSPTEIPEGICFVIVGQPAELYENYPAWLRHDHAGVKRIDIPALLKEDIEQLITDCVSQFSEEAGRVSELVYSLTKGNNLSVVYAIESIKTCSTYDELIELSASGEICEDVNQYYNHIWKHVADAIIRKNMAESFAEAKIADAILLLNGRIYTRLLHEALNDISLSIPEWEQLMDMLYPLIVPTATKHEYNIFHNDFRIFLMGVGKRYSSIYKALALQIAQYLHESDWGIIKYKNEIPLLLCAEKTELVMDYFDTSFVINSLAEGISYRELDKYANIAYVEAVKTQQIQKYHNVYLALTTMHQHRVYFEHYSRQYTEKDSQDIISIDISEIRAKRLSKDNIDDYYDTLIRCQKLFLANTPDMTRRALSLYELWFGSWNPLSFIKQVYPNGSYPDHFASEVNVDETLKKWGEVAAQLHIPEDHSPCRDVQKLHDYELRTEMSYGDAYFTYYFTHSFYEDAIKSLGKVRVSLHCLSEKLEDILLCGEADLFVEVLESILKQKLEDSTRLVASAILLIGDPLRKIDYETINSIVPIKHILDNTTMNAVTYSYITGVQNSHDDDLIILQKAYSYIDISNEDGIYDKEISYLKLIVRISALLGKWNSQLAQTPDINIRPNVLYQQIHSFFDKPASRSFDFTKAFKFLLYVVLNTPAVEKIMDLDVLCEDLKHVLFSFQHVAMYYKTIILDFLFLHNRDDIVRDYFLSFYGTEGNLLYHQEDWASTHMRFLKYSSVVIPDIANHVTAHLKWDVVGYSGHQETALGFPLEIYKLCAANTPAIWKTFGIRLNRLSEIADTFSNEHSLDICKALSGNAMACGIPSFWRLHFLNTAYQYDLNILHAQLYDLLTIAKNEEDLSAIWILACGLLSWYNIYDMHELGTLFKACLNEASTHNVDAFLDNVKKLTPTQFDIANHELSSVHHSSNVSENEYYQQREKKKKLIEQEFKTMSTDDILDSLVSVDIKIGEWDDVNIAWEEIKTRDEINHSTASRLLNVISPRLEGRQWKYLGCDYILVQLAERLGSEAFWHLASINGHTLTEYDYQISTSNVSYMHLLCSGIFSDDAIILLDAELNCQEQWVTGAGHIDYPKTESAYAQNLTEPRNLSELSMNILLEQFIPNNVHRNEIALQSIYLLCTHNPLMFGWIKTNWGQLMYEQKDAILHICERWTCVVDFREMVDVLKAEYETSNRLSEKLRLYTILVKHAHAIGEASEAIAFNAAAEQYTLLKPIHQGPINDSKVPIGIKVFLDINSKVTGGFDSGRDIISYIQTNTNEPIRPKEYFPRSGDATLVKNPAMRIIDPILYGEEKRNRWSHLPLSWLMQYVLDVDDAWVTTTSPTVTYDDVWRIETELEDCIKEKNLGKADIISQAVLYAGINQNEELLGASLWYPVGHRENGIVVFQTKKVIQKGKLLLNNMIYQTFINYSLLSDLDDLFEHGSEDITEDGICLTRSIVGAAQFVFGNCQIYPSNYLREKFRWMPLFDNPLIWINDKGKRVLRFERIVYPNRDTIQQHYNRQPMLFRWLADKDELSDQLREYCLETRIVRNVNRFDQIMSIE